MGAYQPKGIIRACAANAIQARYDTRARLRLLEEGYCTQAEECVLIVDCLIGEKSSTTREFAPYERSRASNAGEPVLQRLCLRQLLHQLVRRCHWSKCRVVGVDFASASSCRLFMVRQKADAHRGPNLLVLARAAAGMGPLDR